MSFGPFQTEEAGRIILDMTKDKIIPTVKDLRELSMEVANHKVDFISSFYRKKLNELNERYRRENKKFLEIYHTYSTPDLLFGNTTEINRERTGLMMGDYMNSKGVIMENFKEGFHFIEILDRQLVRRFQAADQIVSIILSLAAITISVITILLNW